MVCNLNNKKAWKIDIRFSSSWKETRTFACFDVKIFIYYYGTNTEANLNRTRKLSLASETRYK